MNFNESADMFSLTVDRYSPSSAAYLFPQMALVKALKDGTTVNNVAESFKVSKKFVFKEAVEHFVQLGGQKLWVEGKSDRHVIYWPEHGGFGFSLDKKTHYLNYSLIINNKELYDKIFEYFNSFKEDDKKPSLYTLEINTSGLTYRYVDPCSDYVFIPENYSSKVVSDLEKTKEKILVENPKGRIAILEGPPGTGKTNIIQHLIGQSEYKYMIIPSNLATKIDSPEFMSLLHSLKNSEDKPLVLIIEDGDTCLVKRKGENSSAISALLNLTDGIVGKLLDIRVIITTNMNIYEMDDAVLRPGRLGGRIVVKELSYEESLNIFRRLMKDENANLPDKREYTLAEVYAIFNNDGKMPEFMLDVKKQKKVVGFSFEPQETNKFLNKSE